MSTTAPHPKTAPLAISQAPVFYITNNGRFCDTFASEYPGLLAELHNTITWEEAFAAHLAGHELLVDRPGTTHVVLFTVARFHEGFRKMIALEFTTIIS